MSLPPLADFLDTKPLFYTKFDPERIKDAFRFIQNHIKNPKRVQIVGTNGKGSTGRALAYLAYKSGLGVGHFSSPHIFDFKERFWINNRFATNEELEEAHKKLFSLLGEELAKSLSYFEYQALLCAFVFEKLDLVVMEAGLGGEHDATSVFSYDINIFTPIAFDHSDFLGNSLEEIATTKLKAMQKKAILSKQPFKQTLMVAKELAKQKNIPLVFFDEERYKQIQELITKSYPNYLLENFTTATQALDELGIAYNLKDLNSLKLFGRFYKIASNVIIDVGHNPLAAKAIAKALDKKIILIFNILGDKDAKEVLEILKPKIKKVSILPFENERVMKQEELEKLLEELTIPYDIFDGVLQEDEEYLVFGSFYTVNQFLKQINYTF